MPLEIGIYRILLMLARLGKVMFWFTVNVGVIDFRSTLAICIVLGGVGLGVLVSLAGGRA